MSWTPDQPDSGSWPPPGPTTPPPAGGYGAPDYGAPGYGTPGYGAPGYGTPGVPGSPGYGGYGYTPPQDHPQGTVVLVLGVLSLVFCQILGPVAWIMGNNALKEIDASPGYYANRGSVQAGRICGIVSSVLMILLFAFFAFVIVIGLLAGESESRFVEVDGTVSGVISTALVGLLPPGT